MADFLPAYERMIRNEGGYRLSDHPADTGGQTYAGIARRKHPGWPGWMYVDRGETPPTPLVRTFYMEQFWEPLKAPQITHQDVAQSMFDFAVNAGVGTAVKLAQVVVGTTPDGKIGPITLAAINRADPDLFMARFALAKVARYAEIVRRDRSQGVFLLGWVLRALREAQ